MGAWRTIRHRLEEAAAGVPVRYVGRPWRASTAEGYPTAHALEQERIARAVAQLSDAQPPLRGAALGFPAHEPRPVPARQREQLAAARRRQPPPEAPEERDRPHAARPRPTSLGRLLIPGFSLSGRSL